ncbi:hypothetical protein IVA79_17345 [Bradyrhizobium sp. 138]|nr:hypothetical protein [Bradyrhizobium sp. 138]
MVGIFPNEEAITRLIGASARTERRVGVQRGRYMTLETITPLGDDTAVSFPAIASCPAHADKRGEPHSYTRARDTIAQLHNRAQWDDCIDGITLVARKQGALDVNSMLSHPIEANFALAYEATTSATTSPERMTAGCSLARNVSLGRDDT